MTDLLPTDRRASGSSRSGLATALIVLAVLLALAFVWFTASSLLVIFAGILFAAFLDACARALKPILPVGRTIRLVIVIAALSLLAIVGTVRGVVQLPEQVRSLIAIIDSQLDFLQEKLLAFGIESLGPEGGRNFQGLLPDMGQMFGHAQFAVGTATSVLTTTIVIVFVGLMFCFDPASYRDGVVRLVPIGRRDRVRSVMDEMGGALRAWLIGQAARMLLMGVAVWIALYALGVPGAFVLGIQAGLLNFIPYLGPIVAAIPVALVAMPLGTAMLIWAVGIYTVIQTVEGYIIGPLIQKKAAEVPPAWTLVGIVIAGTLFGTLGVALAMPLMAIGRIALIRFYVEDWLRDRAG
ncbi:Predicted PurR-regulated permease PerM [Kaistia soli DSM 19436]|uniref:Predicted PurR-regulated permease PerM n=1 Tax=Kaistia soli DSM 19436 TaxID=1122133 RepID=A0A1M5GEN1_9HYPH|nr:AI-2E family transporter [Kaistia soli]SHG02205.1 Predicted PurR-regulated permease PerM [Kaistia soli DSM 19436]